MGRRRNFLANEHIWRFFLFRPRRASVKRRGEEEWSKGGKGGGEKNPGLCRSMPPFVSNEREGKRREGKTLLERGKERREWDGNSVS